MNKTVKNFREILLHIQNGLVEEEYKELLFLKGLPSKVEERCQRDVLVFWKYMGEKVETYRYHENDPSELFEDLRKIGKEALAKEAETQYEKWNQSRPVMSSLNDVPSSKIPALASRTLTDAQQSANNSNAPHAPLSTPDAIDAKNRGSTGHSSAPKAGDVGRSEATVDLRSLMDKLPDIPKEAPSSGSMGAEESLIGVAQAAQKKGDSRMGLPGECDGVTSSGLTSSPSGPIESYSGLPSSKQLPTMAGGAMAGINSGSVSDALPRASANADVTPALTSEPSKRLHGAVPKHMSQPLHPASPGVVKSKQTLPQHIQYSSTPANMAGLHFSECGGSSPPHPAESQGMVPDQSDVELDASDLQANMSCDVVKDSATALVTDSPLSAVTGKQQGVLVLRGYQKELMVPGLEGKNYIICAPTGSGKTLTAAHICYHRMQTERNKHAFRALFIVPTRHLKKQQGDAFQDLFSKQEVKTLGDNQQFSEVFRNQCVRILMVTAQVVVNAIKQGQFQLADASMLVFDECHHTTLKHPYNVIMRQYLKEKRALLQGSKADWSVGHRLQGLPQVIGLTASIGTGTSDNAENHITTLCANLDSEKVQVVSSPENIKEFYQYNNPPKDDEILATAPREMTSTGKELIGLVTSIMKEIEEKVQERHAKDLLGFPGKPSTYGSKEYEAWVGTVRSKTEAGNPELHVCALYLFRLNQAIMIYEDLRATDVLDYLERFHRNVRQKLDDVTECRQIYEKYSHELQAAAAKDEPMNNPKLHRLKKLLKEEYEANSESIVIILVRTRFATVALSSFIRDSPDLSELIRPDRMVGQSNHLVDGMTEAQQKAVVERFKKGDVNLLVATDIIQEGLDVPACNGLIRYNFVSNEIGTVQSKGRARAQNSKCFLIVESGSPNEEREYENRRRVKDMEEAIHTVNKDPRSWLGLVKKKQDIILADMERKDAEKQAQEQKNPASSWELLCSNTTCEAFICSAIHLELRGQNYTCLDSTIQERTVTRNLEETECYRESRDVGSLHCQRCDNKLGKAVEFLRMGEWEPGYALRVKSFTFHNRTNSEKKPLKKWAKAAFPIAVEQIP